MSPADGKPRMPNVPGDSRVEDWLTSRGVRFLPPYQLPLSLIDQKRSIHNQARPDALVDEAVERYVVARKNGKTFPPIVVFFPGGGLMDLGQLVHSGERAVVIDGNHRVASAKKVGMDSHPTYIVAPDTPSEKIMLLTVEANSAHGEAVSHEWRVRQALDLVGVGFDLEVAAGAANVTVNSVRTQRTLDSVNERARDLKIPAFPALSGVVRGHLSRVKDDRPFAAMTRLVQDLRLPGVEVGSLVSQVNRCKSEEERLGFIDKTRDRMSLELKTRQATRSKKGKISSTKMQLAQSIGMIMKIRPDDLRRSIVKKDEAKELSSRIEAVTDHLLNLQIALGEE